MALLILGTDQLQRRRRDGAQERVSLSMRGGLLLQHGGVNLEFEIRQEAESDLQPGELGLGHASDFGEAIVRVTQIFERFHGDSQAGQE